MRGPDWKPRIDDPEIQEYLLDVAGERGLELFQYILENEPIDGVEIIEAHGEEKASDIRKILYALMEAHALEYHKDTDKKGWETFTWQTDLPELKLIHMRKWKEELEDLRKQLKYESSHEFYTCPHQHRRVIFEDAMETDFHCPVCEEPMEPLPNEQVVADLEARIEEYGAALEA